MTAKLTSSSPSMRPTAKEQEKAAAYLASTRDDLLEAVRDLSLEQWRFTPDSNAWSIAGIVEHLAIVEGRVQTVLAKLPNTISPDPERIDRELDAKILTSVSTRNSRVSAPLQTIPTGNFSPSEVLRDFCEKRTQTLRLLETSTGLRGCIVSHPMLGPCDGYQWILSVAAHTERHLDQISEIKARQSFPSAG